MKAGISKLQKEFKWRGRRYWGGVTGGIGIGICFGFLIALQLGWKLSSVRFAIYSPIIIIMGISFISILSHLILGKRPKE
jgi:hypothetical protein